MTRRLRRCALVLCGVCERDSSKQRCGCDSDCLSHRGPSEAVEFSTTWLMDARSKGTGIGTNDSRLTFVGAGVGACPRSSNPEGPPSDNVLPGGGLSVAWAIRLRDADPIAAAGKSTGSRSRTAATRPWNEFWIRSDENSCSTSLDYP